MRPRVRTFLLILASGSLWAQLETGEMAGVVTQAGGAPLSGATVTLTSRSTGARRSAQTSKRGDYVVALLLPDEYRVEVSAPGLPATSRNVVIHPGARAVANFQFDSGVTRDPAAAPEFSSAGGSQFVSRQELATLPNLGRNAYEMLRLAGNVSDAGLGNRGAGLAINGQRESSTTLLLEGVGARNEFFGAMGQPVPLESVGEISILANGFPARYGRASGGIVSVTTKSGGSQFHGSGFEFFRSSALTGNSFDANAKAIAKPQFTRHDFGYSLGGPLVRGKLFFFSSTEVRHVESNSTFFAWVAAPGLLSQTSANTQAYFGLLGKLRPDAAVVGSVSLNALTAPHGANPCTGLACASLSPAAPLLLRVSYRAPNWSPAGYPQRTVQTLGRIDYHHSPSTTVYGRYALALESTPPGTLSNSPYSNYDLNRDQTDNTVGVSILRTWSSRWTSETTAGFHRYTTSQQGFTSRGLVPSMYANPFGPVRIVNDSLVFPGYNPLTPGSGGAFGGPENVLMLNHEMAWRKGRHLFRFGGAFDTIRDNRTYGAYQTAVGSLAGGGGLGPALNGLIAGSFAHFQVAVDPQGRIPCAFPPSCAMTLPATSPDFTRMNRYSDGAAYVEDAWKLMRRLTVNLGLRWEHFGVQHDARPGKDSNYYAPGVSAQTDLARFLRKGGLQLASASPIGELWKPDWKDFAPRAGIAFDVFGRGRTVVRAGYGIGYERNIGNVTFNLMQNAPSYAVLDIPSPITTSNLGPLSGTGPQLLPPLGARIVDPELKTARAHFWNAAVEQRVSATIAYRLEYSGSRGVDLYSISYPNQAGFGNVVLGDNCVGVGDCGSQPLEVYSEEVGYRGNQGFSRYKAFTNSLNVTNVFRTGFSFRATYTWSHAIDNLSSTFFEAGGQGILSQFGNQNITINNGLFVAGLFDPYHPDLDRGDAEFDVRHRGVVSGLWNLPSSRRAGWMRTLTSGWSVVPVFLARSGQPFSVFDTSQQVLALNAPRAIFQGSHPVKRNTYVAGDTANIFHLITFLPAQIVRQPAKLTPGSTWPAGMSTRDSFRAPGFWNLDLGIHKDTKIGDRFAVQFRADAFNVLNHANLYIIGSSADLGKTNTVDGCYGCTASSYDQRQIQLAIRVTF